ncbi:MAG: hypothetical protein J3Q66DRAFT_409908 [Benniella sp.]|nr:MAG: hypothetical protein J3Q66DRAFT_409908 [Benniella sp.]
MADKKITPHQLRKNLAYVQQGAPDFMRMLTGQSSTAASKDPRNPYKKPIGIEAKFQTEQSDDDDDEPAHDLLNDREEERPTVVVLKDGKHLDERQVRNVLKNLPPGLSEAEIQKRLAEELEKHHDGQGERSDGEEEEDDEQDDDQSPSVDENGKILFRRPKGSKLKGKTGSASSSKKSFEETLLGDARAKANDLKRKAGSSGGATSSQPSTTATSVSSSSSKSTAGGDTTKKKKQKTAKTAKTTSLLSFDDEE